MGIKCKEFIALPCVLYLLKKSRTGMPKLEATFETVVDAYMFLDKNKDDEMVHAINESWGCSPRRIAMKRLEEMDWDKNGVVNFKEAVFAFTQMGRDDKEEGKENA